MSLLCKLGFHKWENAGSYNNWSSNVVEYKKGCVRCKKTKVIVKPK